jgi:hypothetical protein
MLISWSSKESSVDPKVSSSPKSPCCPAIKYHWNENSCSWHKFSVKAQPVRTPKTILRFTVVLFHEQGSCTSCSRRQRTQRPDTYGQNLKILSS